MPKVPISKISGQNDIWMQTLWLIIENIIREKVVASPKSKPWWVLWVCVCPDLFVHQKCSNYAQTNLLFGLYRSMWIINLLVTLLNPHPITNLTCKFSIITPTRPSYLWSVMSQGAYSDSFRYFHLRTCIWIFQEIWGCTIKSGFWLWVSSSLL